MNISKRSERISNLTPCKWGSITKSDKILFLSHIYPPGVDGGSQIVKKIKEGYEKEGKETLVITSDGYSTDDFVLPNKKRITTPKASQLGGQGDTIRIKTLRRPKKLMRRIVGPVFFGFPWLKVIRWRPDLIVGGVYPTTIPIYVWLCSKLTGAKLGLVPCFHREDKSFYRWPLIPILKSADLIYALTESEKVFYQSKFKIHDSRIKVFRPRVDKELVLPRNKPAPFPKVPTILYLGNQAAHKRIIMLIKAFELLITKRKYLGTKLIIAGKRTLYSPEIDKYISTLPEDIKENIDLRGEYNRDEEKLLLDQATVLVNPSKHESLGLVFLEAWARKKPVIGADLLSLQELISVGENGLLFEKESVRDLSDKIIEVISDQVLARKMGERGYRKVMINDL